MGQPIELTRLEHSASDLRGVAAKTGDGGWVRRLLAIALLLDGHSREAAASANGMTRQTLRDWSSLQRRWRDRVAIADQPWPPTGSEREPQGGTEIHRARRA